MRFFTPQLFIQFGSEDDEEANGADEAWDEAMERYERHLVPIKKKLPRSAMPLAETSFHDWEFLASDTSSQNSIRLSPLKKRLSSAWIYLQLGGQVADLFYVLSGPVKEQLSGLHKEFGTGTKIWLYDEIDRHEKISDSFVHRILWSDGNETEIPFYTAALHTFAVHEFEAKMRTSTAAP